MKRCQIVLALIAGVAFIACDDAPVQPRSATAPDAQFAMGANSVEYDPHTPSQMVACGLVDQTLAKIPHGDGIRPVTEEETGPGGWRYNGDGFSFVTFNFLWDGASQYDVFAGRSNQVGNAGIINDYPEVLDLPQDPSEGQRTFQRNHGTINLSVDEFPAIEAPDGALKINLRFVGMDSGDRIYEGCGKSPLLANFGFVVPEGGDFVQQELFKLWARTDGDFNVLEWEFTEVSTFKNTTPDGN